MSRCHVEVRFSVAFAICLFALLSQGSLSGQEPRAQIASQVASQRNSSAASSRPEKPTVESLRSRIEALEQQVDQLQKSGAKADLPPIERVKHDRKTDASGVTQDDVNAIWNQIDKILEALDRLSKK